MDIDFGRVDFTDGWSESASRTPGASNSIMHLENEFKFSWIPGGEFWMGSPEEEFMRFPENEKLHKVTLTHGFWLATTVVSQGVYESIMGNNPVEERYQDDKREEDKVFVGKEFPVTRVSRDDALKFVDKLNEAGIAPEGQVFALPTEAQWERACRAGTDTPFSWGDSYDGSQCNTFASYPGLDKKREIETVNHYTAVDSYLPNRWNLYCMHGNVFEWCQDAFCAELTDAVDPLILESDSECKDEFVMRGGAYNGGCVGVRSAYRSYHRESSYSNGDVGFRIALVPVGSRD